MPTWPNAAAFARDLERMQDDLARKEAKRITLAAAKEARLIAYREAAKDLGGDPKFSGWRPWLRLDVKPTRGFGALIKPTRQSAGPWTVAEFGRNQGNAGGGAFFGPGANRRTGSTRRRGDGSVAKVRAFRSRRWNGYTAGKGTASRADSVMDAKIPPMIEKQVTKVMRRRFDVS